MRIDQTLDHALVSQTHADGLSHEFDELLLIAKGYTWTENAIAVLSDLERQESYLFYGGVGEILGIAPRGTCHHIATIWEEEIMERIHPDDLLAKQVGELRFFYFVNRPETACPSDYLYEQTVRMKDHDGVYHFINHRIIYDHAAHSESIRLALCLYTIRTDKKMVSRIMNTATGEEIPIDRQNCPDILSGREKEILRMIEEGHPSKEIADKLSISINTVSRHRQNIREKLHVSNSYEACRMAKAMNMI